MTPNSLSARAFIALQYLLPHHLLSACVRWLTRQRWPWLKRLLIDAFLRGFAVDMSEAAESDAQRYRSFNEFFTRALKPDARPAPMTTDALASPVDGTVSAVGFCDDQTLVQAKAQHYTLSALLAQQPQWVERFRGGRFLTIYLAPYNYHRVHMPLTGTLCAASFVPGRLFSVNAVTAAHVPGLFARNERITTMFESDRGPFAVILVGALFVGSMSTVWHGDVKPASRRVTSLASSAERAAELQAPRLLPRGAEMGRFNMGSTIILLLPPGVGRWSDDVHVGKVVRLGQVIGQWP